MATCGYLCPACEGRGFTGDGEICTWCIVPAGQSKEQNKQDEIDQWISSVHEGPCCGDLGANTEDGDEQED